MTVEDVGSEGVCWVNLARGFVEWWTVVNTLMNLRIPQKLVDFFSSKLLNNGLAEWN
jgi:hypothetical protein